MRKNKQAPDLNPPMSLSVRAARDALQHGADEISAKPDVEFEKNHLDIAGLWQAYLESRYGASFDITGADVAKMMLLVDVAVSIESDHPSVNEAIVQSAGRVVGMVEADKHGS